MLTIHKVVGGIDLGGAEEAEALKVGLDLAGGPKVDGLAALAQEEDLVEHLKDLVARLVEHGDDGHAELAELLEAVADGFAAARVQATGGLIEEEHGGVRHELNAHVDSLALPPTDPAHILITNGGVANLTEPQHVHHILHKGSAVLR